MPRACTRHPLSTLQRREAQPWYFNLSLPWPRHSSSPHLPAAVSCEASTPPPPGAPVHPTPTPGTSGQDVQLRGLQREQCSTGELGQVPVPYPSCLLEVLSQFLASGADMTVLLPRTPSTLRLSPGLQPPYCAPDPTSHPLWGWDHRGWAALCVLGSLGWAGNGQGLGRAAGLTGSHSTCGINEFGGCGCRPVAQASVGHRVVGTPGQEGKASCQRCSWHRAKRSPAPGQVAGGAGRWLAAPPPP